MEFWLKRHPPSPILKSVFLMWEIIVELIAFQSELSADLLKNHSLDLPDAFTRYIEMLRHLG